MIARPLLRASGFAAGHGYELERRSLRWLAASAAGVCLRTATAGRGSAQER